MHCYYRVSDNSYKKPKLDGATKKRCLLNFLTLWPIEEITVFMDKCVPETVAFLEGYSETTGLKVIPIDGGSSAQGFKAVVDTACELPAGEFVYLVEDDFWHLDHSRMVLLEGLQRADYVTLYDHPDKYIPSIRGGNPFIDEDGGEDTKVILTPSSHWKLTNSTTCTFATSAGVLRHDYPIWQKWCFANPTQTHPNDFQAFLELRETGRSLISPIPALSTHCEPDWTAPLIDWKQEML